MAKKKQQSMELNGISNILMILASDECSFTTEMGTDNGPTAIQCIPLDQMDSIKEQLHLLERYMCAYNKAITEGTQTPYWHEILANPNQYPLNSNRKPKR